MAGNRIETLPGATGYVKFVEVKNVRCQPYTGNVKAMLNYLEKRGQGGFELIVRDGTKLSQPLLDRFRAFELNPNYDITVLLVNRSDNARSFLLLREP